jgi:hypothetical protein
MEKVQILIDLQDILVIITYFLMSALNFFSIYVLAGKLTNDRKTRLLAGVASPFIYIVLGFPFKLYGVIQIFIALQYSVFCLAVYYGLKEFKGLKFKNCKEAISKKDLTVYGTLILGSLYFLINESVKNLTYAFPDTLTSHSWVISTLTNSNNGFYQPGFGIHLAPMYQFVNTEASLDFLGFAIGFTLIIYVVIILEIVRKFLSLYFLALYFLPLFVENQKYLIGFSSNQFFLLYLLLIFILIFEVGAKNKDVGIKLSILSMVILSIGITTPPLLLHLIYYFVVLLLLLPIFSNYSFIKILSINFVGCISAFLYFLNSNTSLINLINFFNSITSFVSATNTDSQLIVNQQGTSELVTDVLKAKLIMDPFSSLFNFFGFLVFLVSVLLLIYSIYRKYLFLSIIATSCLVFAISLFYGVGQFSFITGRVGLYFVVASVFLFSYTLNKIIQKSKISPWTILILLSIFSLNLTRPPAEYRFDNEIIQIQTFKFSNTFESKVYLFSTLSNIEIFPLKNSKIILVENLNEHLYDCFSRQCYPLVVVLDKSLRTPDPILSRSISKQFIANPKVLDEFYTARENIIKENVNLETNLIIQGFEIYLFNSEYSILFKGQEKD